MMKRSTGSFLLLAAALTGCVAASQYSGDGRLVDNGAGAATDRYVLDLGAISLTNPGSTTYTLAGLPSTDFVVGIELRGSASNVESGSINPTVAMVLTDGSKTVMSKKASLRDWTWSIHAPGNYAFVYGREQASTNFTPSPGKRYKLTVTTEQPDRSAVNYQAALVAKSAGWK